jgi:uncharacterized lipoprotein YmbA
MTRIFSILALALLASCSSDPTLRYAVPEVAAGDQISINARTIEVREVALPSYAAQEEIFFETPDGALISDTSLLWADDPTRAITLTLSRTLGAVTSARVAAEPWPFDELPNARIEVRVEEMVAGNDGQFRLSGQYFISSPDQIIREHAHTFSITAPYDMAGGARSIAVARATTVRDLAREIAAKGL